jgi:hypothetical protein
MEKDIATTLGNLDVVCGKKLEITPEELEIIAKQLRLAAEERANPGDIVQIRFKGIIWQYNPHLSRGDLERKLSMKIQPTIENEIALVSAFAER